MIFGLRNGRGLAIFNNIFCHQYDLVFPFFIDSQGYLSGFAPQVDNPEHTGSSSLLVVIPHQESTTFFLGNSKLALPLPVTCKVTIKGVI